MNLRPIDPPRRRPAPTEFHVDSYSEPLRLTARTLIVAVKDNCLGCAEFMAEPSLDGWNLLLVARNDIPHAPQVLVSTEAFALFDIRSEPFFVALDGEPLMIVTEGVPFSLSHTLEQLPQ